MKRVRNLADKPKCDGSGCARRLTLVRTGERRFLVACLESLIVIFSLIWLLRAIFRKKTVDAVRRVEKKEAILTKKRPPRDLLGN